MRFALRVATTSALAFLALAVALPMAVLLGGALHSIGWGLAARPLSTGLLVLVAAALALRRRKAMAVAMAAGPLLLITPLGWVWGQILAASALKLLQLLR